MATVENAPACYRDPRWTDPQFLCRKILKKKPLAQNSAPEKHPENTGNKPSKHQERPFGFFSWYIERIFSGFQNFGPVAVFFQCFSGKFQVWPSWVSVAVRGVLKARGEECEKVRKQTAKQGQEQTGRKARKGAKKRRNGRRRAKPGKRMRKRSGCLFGVAANGGLRDGGLSKSEDIRGKRPFSCVFWIFQVLFRPSGKGRKRPKKGGQTPLKPPFVTPPFAAVQFFVVFWGLWPSSSGLDAVAISIFYLLGQGENTPTPLQLYFRWCFTGFPSRGCTSLGRKQ